MDQSDSVGGGELLVRRRDGEKRKMEGPAVERRSVGRRKVARRRQIDPTTCERDYSSDELEFMQALDAYKRSSGRMFPTCSEILEVVRALGYVRPDRAAASGDGMSEDGMGGDGMAGAGGGEGGAGGGEAISQDADVMLAQG